MRVRPLAIAVLVLGTPAVFFVAQHFAHVPEMRFAEALRRAEEQPSEERAPKVLIRGVVHAVPAAGQVSPTFWMQDAEGTVFAVEYEGGEALPVLAPGMRVVVLGHAHGGASPFFHASEVRVER